MARAGAALNEPEYVITADEVASFIMSRMRRDDGRLLHSWRNGHAKLDAYLDDYAALANSLVSLYEANFKERWIDEAVRLMDIVLDKFADPAGGGFFYTASDHEQLIARNKELTDSSMPSGNSLAANALLRLGRLLGRSDYLDAAEQILAAAVPIMQRAPMAAGQMLLALDLYMGPQTSWCSSATWRATIRSRRLPRFIGVICRGAFLPLAIRARPIRPVRSRGTSTKSSKARNRRTASRCCMCARILPAARRRSGLLKLKRRLEQLAREKDSLAAVGTRLAPSRLLATSSTRAGRRLHVPIRIRA